MKTALNYFKVVQNIVFRLPSKPILLIDRVQETDVLLCLFVWVMYWF